MSSIAAYQSAVEEAKNAVYECQCMSQIISRGERALCQWRTAMVSNCEVGFPPEVALTRHGESIDAKVWPTAKQIAERLSRYHSAVQDLRNKYAAIPESERSVVTSPDSLGILR